VRAIFLAKLKKLHIILGFETDSLSSWGDAQWSGEILSAAADLWRPENDIGSWSTVMNLVRWFRKNRTKVMAVVVIVILFGFIGGGTLLQQLSRRRKRTLAYFGEGKKITNFDLDAARRELDTLTMLRADDLLRGIDLRGIMLGELLFSDGRASAALIGRIRQIVRANQYTISDRQIIDVYKRPVPSSDLYWLLLREEARLAGIMVPNEDVGRQLVQVLPQLFNGQTYSRVMRSLVDRQGIPQDQILATFGKLLAVLFYAQTVCSTEAVTSSQMMHTASWENETIDIEFVRFDPAVFAETQDEPNEEQVVEHFDKYKRFFAGEVGEENPYGFGYKLADRVQLEYMIVKLGDVSATVTPPTYEETEEYYQRHVKEFSETVPEDPNDPNSPLVERTKRYAEVAGAISEGLMQDKINMKADTILQEAKTLTEAKLQEENIDIENVGAETLKQLAGDYKTAAEQLSKKHGVKVYTGRTGLLSAADMRVDEYLGRLFVTRPGYSPVPLTRIVFSIDELGVSELGPFDMPTPRMYEDIGPAVDLMRQMMKETSGQIMVVVRVIEATKSCEPETINQTFDKGTLEFEQDQEQSSEEVTKSDEESGETHKVYSVREGVVEDLKKLAAIDTTKSKAEEFIGLVAENGWESTVDKFNELYGQGAERDESDPNVFKLEEFAGLQRISSKTLATLAVQSEGYPGERLFVREAQKLLSVSEAKIEREFIDKLYSLVPQDSNAVDAVPLIMDFKPNMGTYVIKNISVKRLSQEEYEQLKAMRLYREDGIQSQSLTVTHFNPENILKRMNFRPARERKEPADANAPAESEEG